MLHPTREEPVELTDSGYIPRLNELVESGERITKSAFLKDDSSITHDVSTAKAKATKAQQLQYSIKC